MELDRLLALERASGGVETSLGVCEASFLIDMRDIAGMGIEGVAVAGDCKWRDGGV